MDKAEDCHARSADVPGNEEAIMDVGHVQGNDDVDTGGRSAIAGTPSGDGPTRKKVKANQDIDNDLFQDGGRDPSGSKTADSYYQMAISPSWGSPEPALTVRMTKPPIPCRKQTCQARTLRTSSPTSRVVFEWGRGDLKTAATVWPCTRCLSCRELVPRLGQVSVD